MASKTKPQHDLPPGHVPLPVMLTGGMGMVLAGGMHFFGMLRHLDRSLAGVFMDPVIDVEQAVVSIPLLWLATALLTFGIAWVILRIPGNWRRVVIWISTLAVIVGWVPVAAIANASAPVGAPLVACGWAGLCAIIYASRHHMETDGPTIVESPSTPHEEVSQDGTD
jgi:hypothetical protein